MPKVRKRRDAQKVKVHTPVSAPQKKTTTVKSFLKSVKKK